MSKFQMRDLLGMGQSIALAAPAAGWLVASADGSAAGLIIDPADEGLRAPCDGVVTRVDRDPLGLVLILANGAELRLMSGVALRGRGKGGAELHVAAGQWVWTGDPLMSFGTDARARTAQTRLISMTVRGGGRGATFQMPSLVAGRPVACGETLARVRLVSAGRGER